jgi:hypothetical protein
LVAYPFLPQLARAVFKARETGQLCIHVVVGELHQTQVIEDEMLRQGGSKRTLMGSRINEID